jgi:hypothetical protein
VAFGLPFAAGGAALVLFGAGVRGGALRGGPGPRWLAAAVGLVFAWIGLAFVVHGARELRRRRAVRRLERRHPGQPWWSDHPWDPRGAGDQTLAEAVRAACVALFVLLFLVPFHWVGFFAPHRVVVFGLFALVFDAVALGLVWRALYLVVRMLKYGRGAVAFARFPFRRGELVELFVAVPSGVSAPSELVATLRCVQERFEVRGSGKGRSTEVVSYELLAPATAVTAVTPPPGHAGGAAFRIAARIPADAPATALAERPARYWELELSAALPGVDYGAAFLVPVY